MNGLPGFQRLGRLGGATGETDVFDFEVVAVVIV